MSPQQQYPPAPDPSYRRLQAPTSLIVLCVTFVVVTLIGAFTALAYTGRDSGSLAQLVNVMTGLASAVLSGGAALYAGSADRKAGRAIEQSTNNPDAAQIETLVHQALREELTRRLPPTLPPAQGRSGNAPG